MKMLEPEEMFVNRFQFSGFKLNFKWILAIKIELNIKTHLIYMIKNG